MSPDSCSVISQLRPLDNQANLGQKVAARLREAIKDGVLPPGIRLVERDIADQLGISRMPVREAIRQLVDEGLVVKEPRRGAYVQPYAAEELEEVYSLRVVLERFVVERVMVHWSEDARRRLQATVDAMVQAAKADNKHRVYELDARFHETLWELAEHRLLLEVVSGLRDRISRFLIEATQALSPEALDTHVDTHRQLIEVLDSGDIEAARTEISHHILIAKNRIKAHYRYLDDEQSAEG